ncbi:MAG: tetratricopeptide repeat protein [Pirellulales bacterium]
MRDWTLNVRLLTWTVAMLVVLGPAVYAIRAFQVRRSAVVLFERAQELEDQGDLASAANTLFRYLKFHPDDASARVLLAQVYDKTAATFGAKQRATEHYYTALTHFPDRKDLRTRLAEILLELDRPREARQESLRVLCGSSDLPRNEVLEDLKRYQDRFEGPKLLASNADAPRALRVLAEACFKDSAERRDWSPGELLLAAQSALAANPNDIDLTLLIARVYRDRMVDLTPAERAKLADEVVDRMATSHSDAGQANLALYRYRREHDLPNADSALAAALTAAPDDYDVVLAAANDALVKDNREQAESHFKRAIALPDADPRAYTGLAQLQLRQDKTTEAKDSCEDGLARFGADQITLQLMQLQATIQSRDLAKAEDLLVKSVRPLQERLAPLLNVTERTRLRDQIAMLEAELAIAGKKLLRAVAILRQMVVPRSSELRLEADLRERSKRWRRLGEVYDELRYWELAANAYEQEASLEDENYAAHVAAGLAWRACGRLDLAISGFQAALSARDAQPQGWLLLARAELERQMRRTERNWTQVDQPLQQAERLLVDAPAVAMLKIEVLKAKGDHAAAIAELGAATESNPIEVLPFAVLFYERLGQNEQAVESLERLKNLKPKDDASVRLVEIELYRRQKKYDECEQLLNELIKVSKGPELYNLRRQLALIALEHDSDEGEKQLKAFADDYSEDPWPWEVLAELALSNPDYNKKLAEYENKKLAEYETKLEELEGKEGAHWRFYRGMRLIAQAESAKDPGIQQDLLQQALRLHGEVQSLRPAWPLALQLKGRLAQQLGKVEAAAEAYKAAIEAGATSVTVFEGLITLLYANNRWSEADAFLARLQEIGYESPVLESLSARVHLRQGEFQQAVSAARSGATRRARDPLAHIWLGQTLVLAANKEEDAAQRQALIAEAKASFEKAVSIAPEDFRAWGGLLWYHARINDKQVGKRALEGLQTKARLSEPQRMLALGQAHQLLGEYPLAEEKFLQAVRLLPNDSATQERLAQFYLAYSPEKAHQALRRLLELDPKSSMARRALAMLLVAEGGNAELAEAIKLLRAGGDETADKRLEAVLLMQRGGKENLHAARQLLEGLIRESVAADPTDRHLLAVIAEADRDLPGARRQLEQLAEETNSVVHWAALAEFLLRHGSHSDATGPISKLAEASPNAWQTVRIKTRWMKAMGKPSEEIELEIDRYQSETLPTAGGDTQKLAVINRVAGLLAELDLKDQAQARFRAFLQDHPSDRARQVFALWLIKNQRVAEAVHLALEMFEGSSPTEPNIQLLSNVLTIAASHGLRFAAAEARLDEVMQQQTQNANLLLEFATLRHVQGDVQEAIRLYRRVITLVPGNAFARNNFAMLLLEQSDGARESLLQIEEALRISGPLAELRDTYALALAHNDKAEEACRILRGLLSQAPNNPRFLFHLALASRRAGNNVAAAEAFTKAKANNLEAELLTPKERQQIVDLTKALGVAETDSAAAIR